MISLGVSTACLYPEVTERAVDELAAAGVKTIEIFYNSPSEYRPEFLKELNLHIQFAKDHPELSTAKR